MQCNLSDAARLPIALRDEARADATGPRAAWAGIHPHPVELSGEDQAALEAASAKLDRLTEQHHTAEELG